jgi:hypothetical protein
MNRRESDSLVRISPASLSDLSYTPCLNRGQTMPNAFLLDSSDLVG